MGIADKEIYYYSHLKETLLIVCAAIIGTTVTFSQNSDLSGLVKAAVIFLICSLFFGFLQILTEGHIRVWESIFSGQEKLISEWNKLKKNDANLYNTSFKEYHEELVNSYRKRTTTVLEHIVIFLHLDADKMESLFFAFFILGLVLLTISIL